MGMRKSAGAILLTAALTGLPATAADAAPSWSKPFEVFKSTPTSPHVAVSAKGGALFTVPISGQIRVRGRTSKGKLAKVTTIRSRRHLSTYGLPTPAFNTRGDAVIAWGQRDATDQQIRTYAARARVNKAFGAAVRVQATEQERTGNPSAGIDPTGRSFVAYAAFGGVPAEAFVASAPLTGAFGAPVDLKLGDAGGTPTQPDVAVGLRGHVVAATTRLRTNPVTSGDVRVATAAPGQPLGAPATIASLTDLNPTATGLTQAQVASDRFGALGVAWGVERPAGICGRPCHDVYVALRPAGQTAFGKPVRLNAPEAPATGDIEIAMDAATAHVAWHEIIAIGAVSSGTRLVTSRLGPFGEGARITLGNDTGSASLAVDGKSTIIAAWITPRIAGPTGAPNQAGPVTYALRLRGKDFAKAVTIKRARPALSVDAGAGPGGHIALAWLEGRGTAARPFSKSAGVAQFRRP